MKKFNIKEWQDKYNKKRINEIDEFDFLAPPESAGSAEPVQSQLPPENTGKFSVDVQEPFDVSKEQSSFDEFKKEFKPIPPITMVEVEGFISDAEIELDIIFSNGDKIFFYYDTDGFNFTKEAKITIDGNTTELDHSTIEDYLGSTSSVIGDLGLMYTEEFDTLTSLNEADEFERGNADNDNPEATFPHLEDEGLLKSNIAQTWDNKETIKKDLEEFIGMALRAGGPDLVEDIIFKLENATEYAKKSVRTFKTVY